MGADRKVVGDAREMDVAAFGRYKLIVADPPWWYPARKNTNTKFGAGATSYGLLRTEEIAAMPVEKLTLDDCMLALWTTAPRLPDALTVMEAWGFQYSTVGFAWVKSNPGRWQKALDGQNYENIEDFFEKLIFFGPGYYTGSNVELVLFGKKGKALRHSTGRKASQVIFLPRGQHSQKPDEMQLRLEWMYPQATPRLELFARRSRAGWDVFGNDIKE